MAYCSKFVVSTRYRGLAYCSKVSASYLQILQGDCKVLHYDLWLRTCSLSNRLNLFTAGVGVLDAEDCERADANVRGGDLEAEVGTPRERVLLLTLLPSPPSTAAMKLRRTKISCTSRTSAVTLQWTAIVPRVLLARKGIVAVQRGLVCGY